jgi:hypothetical protein
MREARKGSNVVQEESHLSVHQTSRMLDGAMQQGEG